jgi:hypothetical protein
LPVDVVSIDLSNNDITTLASWRRLGRAARSLTNLSLATNAIKVCLQSGDQQPDLP